MDRNKELYRKKDVCEMFKVSNGKLDLMMKDGLKYVKLNRNVRFRVEDINDYLDKNSVR
tara:strand:- start:916 stop:1092 length:177 start_codon:yes stop_codon:yes gene_type:complete